MIRDAFSRTTHHPFPTVRTSVTALVLLLLEGEVLESAQLLDSVAGVVDDSGRTVADQVVDQIQRLVVKRWIRCLP